MESVNAAPHRLTEEGLLDYKMQELVLQEVLPRLGLASLTHLRACCRSLQSLLDSTLCSSVWFPAAQHHLPSRHQMHRMMDLPSRFLKPHQQAVAAVSATNHDTPQQQLQQHHQQPQQQNKQQQQSRSADAPAAKHPGNASQEPDDSLRHPVRIQQFLLEQAALLRRLSQGGGMTFLPISAGVYTSLELWSPCSTWVAMQQYRPNAASSLVIWNTVTGAAQDMVELPRGHFLNVAWLPDSSCLAWVKSHDEAREYTEQSIFCLDVATGQRHQLLNQPYRHWHHKRKPIISASGGLLAYVVNNCVKVSRLPNLEDTATLSSRLHPRPSVAAMSFNPAATHIAITWDGQWDTGNEEAPPLCLEIFATDTQSRCFCMPFNVAVWCSWNPTIHHLLILSSGEGLAMLDVNASRLTPIPIRNNRPLRAASAWTTNGSMAIIRELKPSRGDSTDPTEYVAVRCDGTVGFTWTYGSCGPKFAQEVSTSLSHPQGMPDGLDKYRFHRACSMDLDKEISDILNDRSSAAKQNPRDHISACGRLKVELPSPAVAISRHAGLSHFSIDYLAHSATKHNVVSDLMRGCSAPIWHPSLVGSRIYALTGPEQDVWLVDGHQHRVLQHWQGQDLQQRASCASKAKQAGSKWQRASWSENGARLLLVGDRAIIALDFCSPRCLTGLPDSSRAPVGSAWTESGPWDVVAKSLSQLFWA